MSHPSLYVLINEEFYTHMEREREREREKGGNVVCAKYTPMVPSQI